LPDVGECRGVRQVRPIGQERGVVLPVRTDPAGIRGPRRREAAGPDWRQSSRGLYVPAYVEQTAVQRVAEAGVLVPRYAAITGWAALAWRGGWWFSGLARDGTFLPVPIAVSRHRIRSQPGISLCEERLPQRELEVVDGPQVTLPARSVCFEMRNARGVDAAVTFLRQIGRSHD